MLAIPCSCSNNISVNLFIHLKFQKGEKKDYILNYLRVRDFHILILVKKCHLLLGSKITSYWLLVKKRIQEKNSARRSVDLRYPHTSWPQGSQAAPPSQCRLVVRNPEAVSSKRSKHHHHHELKKIPPLPPPRPSPRSTTTDTR